MPKLKKAVKEFLVAVPAKDQVTLLGFNDSVFALTRKTTDPAGARECGGSPGAVGRDGALRRDRPRAWTCWASRSAARRSWCFPMAKTRAATSRSTTSSGKLQASDVTLYMIAQGRGISQDYLKKTMQRLTVPTGGRTFTTDSVDQLHCAFEELLDELSNQYLLGYPADQLEARRHVARDPRRRWRATRTSAPGRDTGRRHSNDQQGLDAPARARRSGVRVGDRCTAHSSRHHAACSGRRWS